MSMKSSLFQSNWWTLQHYNRQPFAVWQRFLLQTVKQTTLVIKSLLRSLSWLLSYNTNSWIPQNGCCPPWNCKLFIILFLPIFCSSSNVMENGCHVFGPWEETEHLQTAQTNRRQSMSSTQKGVTHTLTLMFFGWEAAAFIHSFTEKKCAKPSRSRDKNLNSIKIAFCLSQI